MAIREFAGASKATSLLGTLSAAATTFDVVDGTGYPSGGTGPFVITISAGLASEEKVLVATRTGNTFSVDTRGYDGTTASDHANAASVQHTISAVDLREANAHVNDTSGDPHPQYLTPAEGAILYAPADDYATQAELDAHTHTVTKTVLIPHTFTLSGEVKVPSGDTGYIPPFFIPVPAGQTVTLVTARHRINSGTSATVSLQKNGADITGWTALSVTPTTTTTDAADAAFADGDALALVVTAVSGAPMNLSFTVNLNYTV